MFSTGWKAIGATASNGRMAITAIAQAAIRQDSPPAERDHGGPMAGAVRSVIAMPWTWLQRLSRIPRAAYQIRVAGPMKDRKSARKRRGRQTATGTIGMKITFHIGAHRTDGDRLMRSLIRNNQKLAEEGIVIPGPSKFRSILHEVATRLKGESANPETLDLVMDTILDGSAASHIVLSYEAFMCGAGMILAEGRYYARADRTAWLRAVFPGHDVRFALGIRNPATHLPAVFETQKDRSFEDFLMGADPLALRWSDPIAQIVAANPGCPVIVWCNEDTPLIWPEVMSAVADHDPETRLKGGFDVLSQIMENEGTRRLRAYLGSHPPQNEAQRRRILAAFLDKYAKEEEIQEVIDVPGWTDSLIASMTEAYEEDLERIRTMSGVGFLAP